MDLFSTWFARLMTLGSVFLASISMPACSIPTLHTDIRIVRESLFADDEAIVILEKEQKSISTTPFSHGMISHTLSRDSFLLKVTVDPSLSSAEIQRLSKENSSDWIDRSFTSGEVDYGVVSHKNPKVVNLAVFGDRVRKKKECANGARGLSSNGDVIFLCDEFAYIYLNGDMESEKEISFRAVLLEADIAWPKLDPRGDSAPSSIIELLEPEITRDAIFFFPRGKLFSRTYQGIVPNGDLIRISKRDWKVTKVHLEVFDFEQPLKVSEHNGDWFLVGVFGKVFPYNSHVSSFRIMNADSTVSFDCPIQPSGLQALFFPSLNSVISFEDDNRNSQIVQHVYDYKNKKEVVFNFDRNLLINSKDGFRLKGVMTVISDPSGTEPFNYIDHSSARLSPDKGQTEQQQH